MDKDEQVTVSIPAMGPGVTRSADYRQIYSNVCRSAFSTWDVQLTFSLAANNASGAAIVEEQATVFMSPSQAKAVAAVLVHAVQQFEENFGEIKLNLAQEPALAQSQPRPQPKPEQPTSTKAAAQE